MTPGDAALIVGSALRLTRLIVVDDIGQWWVKDPLDALFHPGPEDRHGQQVPARLEQKHLHRYLSGLDCPFCVGTWIGFGVLASYALAKRHKRALAGWRFVATGLALNEVVGHTAMRIGDTG
jgi:hypothetical protein